MKIRIEDVEYLAYTEAHPAWPMAVGSKNVFISEKGEVIICGDGQCIVIE